MVNHLGTAIVAISISFSVLAAVAVALRFYCRSIKKASYGIDDWLIIPALLATIGNGIAMTVGVFAGRLGQYPMINLDGDPVIDRSTEVFRMVVFLGQVLITICLAFAKLSVLFFYRRIFMGTIFNAVSWILITLSIAWGISFLIAILTQCIPIEQNWISAAIPQLHCYDTYWLMFTSAVSSVIIDITILCIPWPNIWQIRMPIRQKFAVMGIFMLGGFVCGIGIARIILYVQAIQAASTDPANFHWYLALPMYWTQLEASFAVICACLPILRPVLGIFSFRNVPGNRGRYTSRLPPRVMKPSSDRQSSLLYPHSLNNQSGSTESIADSISDESVDIRHDITVYPSSQLIENSELMKNDG